MSLPTVCKLMMGSSNINATAVSDEMNYRREYYIAVYKAFTPTRDKNSYIYVYSPNKSPDSNPLRQIKKKNFIVTSGEGDELPELTSESYISINNGPAISLSKDFNVQMTSNKYTCNLKGSLIEGALKFEFDIQTSTPGAPIIPYFSCDISLVHKGGQNYNQSTVSMASVGSRREKLMTLGIFYDTNNYLHTIYKHIKDGIEIIDTYQLDKRDYMTYYNRRNPKNFIFMGLAAINLKTKFMYDMFLGKNENGTIEVTLPGVVDRIMSIHESAPTYSKALSGLKTTLNQLSNEHKTSIMEICGRNWEVSKNESDDEFDTWEDIDVQDEEPKSNLRSALDDYMRTNDIGKRGEKSTIYLCDSPMALVKLNYSDTYSTILCEPRCRFLTLKIETRVDDKERFIKDTIERINNSFPDADLARGHVEHKKSKNVYLITVKNHIVAASIVSIYGRYNIDKDIAYISYVATKYDSSLPLHSYRYDVNVNPLYIHPEKHTYEKAYTQCRGAKKEAIEHVLSNWGSQVNSNKPTRYLMGAYNFDSATTDIITSILDQAIGYCAKIRTKRSDVYSEMKREYGDDNTLFDIEFEKYNLEYKKIAEKQLKSSIEPLFSKAEKLGSTKKKMQFYDYIIGYSRSQPALISVINTKRFYALKEYYNEHGDKITKQKDIWAAIEDIITAMMSAKIKDNLLDLNGLDMSRKKIDMKIIEITGGTASKKNKVMMEAIASTKPTTLNAPKNVLFAALKHFNERFNLAFGKNDSDAPTSINMAKIREDQETRFKQLIKKMSSGEILTDADTMFVNNYRTINNLYGAEYNNDVNIGSLHAEIKYHVMRNGDIIKNFNFTPKALALVSMTAPNGQDIDSMKRIYQKLLSKRIIAEYLKIKEKNVNNHISLFVRLITHLLVHEAKIVFDWMSDSDISFGKFMKSRIIDMNLESLKMYNINGHVDKIVDMIVNSNVEKEVFVKRENDDEFVSMDFAGLFNLSSFENKHSSLDKLFYGSITPVTPLSNIDDVYVSTYNLVYPRLCKHKDQFLILSQLLKKGSVAFRKNGEIIDFEQEKARSYVRDICAPVDSHKWCRIKIGNRKKMFYTPARNSKEHQIAIGNVEDDLSKILDTQVKLDEMRQKNIMSAWPEINEKELSGMMNFTPERINQGVIMARARNFIDGSNGPNSYIRSESSNNARAYNQYLISKSIYDGKHTFSVGDKTISEAEMLYVREMFNIHKNGDIVASLEVAKTPNNTSRSAIESQESYESYMDAISLASRYEKYVAMNICRDKDVELKEEDISTFNALCESIWEVSNPDDEYSSKIKLSRFEKSFVDELVKTHNSDNNKDDLTTRSGFDFDTHKKFILSHSQYLNKLAYITMQENNMMYVPHSQRNILDELFSVPEKSYNTFELDGQEDEEDDDNDSTLASDSGTDTSHGPYKSKKKMLSTISFTVIASGYDTLNYL